MSLGQAETRVGRVKPSYLCSTPANDCGGRSPKYSAGLTKMTNKMHSTPQECHKCYVRYLLKNGYTQHGGREFSINGGPILLLNKPSKGTRLRGGKGKRMNSRMETFGLIREGT